MVSRPAQSTESTTEIASGEGEEAQILFASSFAQERLWFLDQLESNSAFYNIHILLRMQGHLDMSVLQRCLAALVERHEALRTTLRIGEEYPLQAIAPYLDVPLPLIDLSGLIEESREATMQQLALQAVEMPFDLNRGPLVYFQISRLSSNDHVLVVSLHHAIVDGWSTEVLLRELSALYNAFVAGEIHSPLPELTLQYADYAAWQRAWLQGDTLEEQITYWLEQLRSAPALIDLPTDQARPAMQSYRGDRYSFRLPDELTAALRAFSRREGVTLFMTLLAAFQTLLLRYSGQNDLVVGTPVAGRSRVELEALVGVFINLLAMRTDLSGDPTVHELLWRIREVCLNAYEHQDMPFEKLVKELQPERSLSYHPIFQVLVNLQNFVIEPVTFTGLTVSTFELPHGTTLFDLTCDWIETKDGLLCRLEYSTDLFEPATIVRLGEHLQRLLESMVANPQQHLSELSMLSQSELNQLLVAWNNTATAYPHDTCLPHLLAAQAARRSEAIALVYEGEHLSYGKLDTLTTQLARHLRALGVGPEQRVGLYLDRSLEMVIGVLGVLKAGGAYVPLDPDYPRGRLAFIARDANLVLLLTRQHLRDQVPPCTCPVLSIETAWAMMEAEAPKEALLSDENQPENLAYVLYTSGSTGTPKGVAIEHRSVVNFLTSMYSQLGPGEQDSILALTSLSFDIAGLEIFLPLISGARVEIASRVVATDGRLLAQHLVASGITLTQATPSTWRMLVEANWPGDSRMKLLCGGEALPPALARALLKLGESLWNLYGPTETTIWSSLQKVQEDMATGSGIVSIGTPLDNTQLYVLDAHGQPVPRGIAGELFIGGAGLARGYLNRPDLTAERFIPHPFSTSPGARLYRTGDRVRFLSDGRLEYLGRLDAQVKLRGYRIELGEIEAILRQHPAIQGAAVVARPAGTQENAVASDPRLLAYIVKSQQEQGLSEKQVAYWQEVWETTYQDAGNAPDPAFNLAGWKSNYTGAAIPAEEMREWVDTTVERILALRPRRVLEVGCGTGLLVASLAPHCEQYWGTDFSSTAIHAVQVLLTERALSNVRLLQRNADDFSGVLAQESGHFDAVILNSVTQYFPDEAYLSRILRGALQLVAPGGILFVGDVRNLLLREAFHTSVQLRRAPLTLLTSQLRELIQRQMALENELLIAPGFFAAFQQQLAEQGHQPLISQVEIQLKRGRAHNELTCFRYDVTLHIGGAVEALAEHEHRNWQDEPLTLPALQRQLEQEQPDVLHVLSVQNARLWTEVQALFLLQQETPPQQVKGIWEAVDQDQQRGIDPEDFWRLGERLSYAVTISPSPEATECYDVLLARRPTTRGADQKRPPLVCPTRQLPGSHHSRRDYTNQPFQAESSSALRAELRAYLKQRLPDYMLPTAITELEALPLTPNGKVDRKALPAPERFTRPEESYSPPDTTIEKQLAVLWSQLLELERVSRYDNFFEVGGHSLLGVRLMLRVGETFQVALPLRTLFQAPTLAELARVVAQEQSEQNQRARARFSLPTVVADTEHRSLPFPLTDVQQAYWIGRDVAFELGNVATHMYREWESHNLDLERLTLAWQRTIARHEMLRAVVLPDGQQQILTDVPPYEIAVQNLYGLPPETIAARLEAVRQQMSHQVFQPDRWPLFELRASQLEGGRTRLHFSSDSLMTDAWSWQILLRELDLLYLDCKRELPALTLSFRDYTLAAHTLRESEMYLGAREYWRKRLPDLPPAPQLPLAQNPAALIQPHFKRYEHLLEPRLWSQLKQTATQLGLTPSGLLLTAFALVIGKWSKSSRFTLNLTLFNRVPLHPEVDDIVGNFTSLTLLEVDQSAPASFHMYAQRLQQQLWEDLEHRSVSGIEVLRELARFNSNPTGATMPVIFTSALGLHRATDDASLRQAQEAGWRARQVYGITQTSQAWLDHQVREQDEALVYFWDVVEDLFPAGLLDVMFNAYNRLLEQLVIDERWETITSAGLVPAQQLEQQAAMNATERPISTELLHTLFTAQAVQRPQQQAVVTPQRSLSYQELAARAQRVGRLLRQRGVQPNQLVAIVMEKGWEQIVGVLGVLYAGGAYLPIDPELPEERVHYLLEHGEVKNALTQSWLNRQISWPGDIKRISVDRLQSDDQISVVLEPPVQGPGDLAYVIYTSGSTGTPKGVMIDHRGAVNTILDINERFAVGPRDRVLALSSLSFDLSVYDIFGILAAGGTIVLPCAEARRDPVHWLTLLEQEHISIWNSVPALMDLTVEYLLHAQIPQTQDLRLVLLSGDWIPLSLPDQVRSVWPDAQVISLGGATEASIWSILFPIGQIDPAWKSIPYGHPMRNQHFYVLNSALEPCPIWVPGELFIGGIGLAQGYWRDEARTNASFFTHPHTGERLYRTGDLGRYLPTGEIEFLGREDFQVKVRGYRIELGEIEAVLNRQARVGQAIVVVREDSPGDKRLVAYVVPTEEGSPPDPAALRQALQDRLPDYMLPAAFVVLEALPLTANGKVNRQALPTPEWTVDSQPDSTIMPRTPVEVELASLFQEVLGLDHVGVQDNFFALGGHSLLAVQLMTRVLETFHVKLPLRALFEQPTVALLSAYLVQSLPSAPPENKQLEREAPSPSVQDLPLEHRQHATPVSTGEVLRDLEERNRFKADQPGLRQKEPASPAIRLAEVQETQAVYRLYAERSSASAFGEHPLAFEKFSGFLSCLRQISLAGKPKHRWGSAGGLYPVQVYLYVKPDGVEGLPAGTYYYHPLDHCLVPIVPGAYISDEVHTWLNQPLHGLSAFSLFLVAQLNAIVPMYGDASQNFCLIEAGLITQVLEMAASAFHIGLCQVGGVDFASIRTLFDLEESHLYLHCLLGGCLATEHEMAHAGNASETWEEGLI